MTKPRIYTLDIETSPHEGRVFDFYNQNLGLNQITKFRTILSWAAKPYGSKEIIYYGTGGQRDVRDDSRILKPLWKLLNGADVLITQNGKKFDLPIIRGRMSEHKMKPFAEPRHIDTCQLATKMGYPSKKLAYLTKVLCPHLEKSKHNTFPGMDLWNACLGDFGPAIQKKAWKEMEAYNKQDTVGTEGVYDRLAPWGGTGVSLSVYTETVTQSCAQLGCDGTYKKDGFRFTNGGKFQGYECDRCGHKTQDKGKANNLLSEEKQQALKGKK